MSTSLNWVSSPVGVWVDEEGRGRSVVQWSLRPMLGPDWAVESLGKMEEVDAVGSGCWASLSGALVASGGEEDIVWMVGSESVDFEGSTSDYFIQISWKTRLL